MSIAEIDKNAVWLAENATIKAIVGEGFGKYLRRLPNHEMAFKLDGLVVVCIDGRTHGEICLAGSGIILGLDGALRFAREVERLYGKIEAITWHDDCGAALAWTKQHDRGGNPTKNAEEFAKKFASALGVRAYLIPNAGHDGFHGERVIYFDATGRFNWARVPGLPVGFTISRAYLGFNVEYAKRELAMALSIALTPHNKGGHGFGEKFTESEPLIIVVIANNRCELEKLKAEAQEVVGALPAVDRKRVHLDGFYTE